MIMIRGPTDIALVTDPDLRRLIALRMSQLADDDVYDPERHGELFVVEPGDVAEDVEFAVSFPILANVVDGSRWGEPDFQPCCDFIHEHATSFELVVSVSDLGFGVFIPNRPGVDAALLSLCAAFATRPA